MSKPTTSNEPKPRKSRRSNLRMSDIATLAGVSSMTVSRALHRPELVSSETRERISAILQSVDFVPDMVAGSLSSTSSRTIGIVVPTLSHAVFADTIQGLSDVLRPLHYQLFVSATGFSLEAEESVVRSMLGRRVDCIVITGLTHSEGTRRMLSGASVPVYEMWNIGRPAIDTAIGFSNRSAAIDMTRYLIAKGHRRIGYMGGTLAHNDRAQDREEGFRHAMAEAGLALPESAVIHAPYEYRGGAHALQELLLAQPDLQAVLAGAEMLAVGAVSMALDLGLSLPQDLAIAAFDDSELSALIRPRLTSIEVPRYELGRQLALDALERMSGNPPRTRRVIDAGYELIVRESA